jgi:hypothetical protein
MPEVMSRVIPSEASRAYVELMRTRETRPAPTICKADCPICAGRGYVRFDRAIGDPDYGKLELCPNVDRWSLPSAKRYGIDRAEAKGLTWDAVADEGQAFQARAAVREVMERGHGWVFLWGSYGLAKTLILKIAVAEVLRSGREGAYTRMAEVIDHLRAAFDAEDPSDESNRRLDWWTNLPILAVDEFDRVRGTEYAEERRFLLMDRRYEAAAREKSITLMASNTDPRSLAGYLADRVLDGRFKVVHLTGQSFRPGMG